MSHRGELDRQPEGLGHGKTLLVVLSAQPKLSPDGGGESARNTKKDVDFKVIMGWGNKCRTCGV